VEIGDPLKPILGERMEGSISVNQAIDQLATASGNLVVVHGFLYFEFEGVSLRHYPVAEQRDELPGAYYSSGASTLWLSTGDGSIQLDESVLRQWNRRRVVVTGTLLGPSKELDGCGHMSGCPGEMLVMSIERE